MEIFGGNVFIGIGLYLGIDLVMKRSSRRKCRRNDEQHPNPNPKKLSVTLHDPDHHLPTSLFPCHPRRTVIPILPPRLRKLHFEQKAHQNSMIHVDQQVKRV